jgi:hypothetical protein
MIIADAPAIVKPAAPTFEMAAYVDSDAPAADHFDAYMDSLSDAQLEAMADESAFSDRYDSGLLPW